MGVKKQIYLIRCRKFIKIGVADDVPKRLATLQIGNPYRMTVRSVSKPTVHWKAVEELLQKAHGGNRIGGEWFLLSVDEVNRLSAVIENTESIEELVGIATWHTDPIGAYRELWGS